MLKVIGISEETDCECCGKQNLKLTVVLARLDADGNEMEFLKFGRDCAAKATGRRVTANKMESIARDEQAKREKAEREKVHMIGDVRSVCTWVVESVGNNGGTFDFVALANGSKAAVERWADKQYPNKSILVRKAI